MDNANEKSKKQIPLRLSAALWQDLAAWAEADFRSINGQIEYLLTECVKQRKKNGGHIPDSIKNNHSEKSNSNSE